MSTTFSSLPIVDLAPLQNSSGLSESDRLALSAKLYNVFATTGFAYLVNTPLSFKHADVFGLALEFFNLPLEEKMKLAKKTFKPENENTYRGWFSPLHRWNQANQDEKILPRPAKRCIRQSQRRLRNGSTTTASALNYRTNLQIQPNRTKHLARLNHLPIPSAARTALRRIAVSLFHHFIAASHIP